MSKMLNNKPYVIAILKKALCTDVNSDEMLNKTANKLYKELFNVDQDISIVKEPKQCWHMVFNRGRHEAYCRIYKSTCKCLTEVQPCSCCGDLTSRKHSLRDEYVCIECSH